jgi:DNA-binding MarR family transcriptional regulator
MVPPVAELPADLDVLAGGLASAIGRLRRALNRHVHAGSDASPLPEAQLEIIRLVRRRPGLRIHDVAAALGLAPNTVSTLVHRLADAGLVERLADPGDARVTHLRLGPAAEERLQRWRDRRGEVLAARLVALGSDDRRALARALPVLERITLTLEAAPSAPARVSAAPSAAPAEPPVIARVS